MTKYPSLSVSSRVFPLHPFYLVVNKGNVDFRLRRRQNIWLPLENGRGWERFCGGGGAYGWCTYVLAIEVGLDRRDALRRGRRKLKVMGFRIVLHDCCMILMMFLPEDHGQADFPELRQDGREERR